jgi:hypothetical protein
MDDHPLLDDEMDFHPLLDNGKESLGMGESRRPAWWDEARRFYSWIEAGLAPVSVFDATGCEEVTSESPGTLCLRLEPRFRYSPRLRILDAGGREEGIIDSGGMVPGVRYVMRRNGQLVWTLSVRSLVRKRHVLELAHGDTWTFDTPFFWWQHLTGSALGVPRLLGGLGTGGWIWIMAIERGRDTIELLAAVAFMHRQWSRM